MSIERNNMLARTNKMIFTTFLALIAGLFIFSASTGCDDAGDDDDSAAADDDDSAAVDDDDSAE